MSATRVSDDSHVILILMGVSSGYQFPLLPGTVVQVGDLSGSPGDTVKARVKAGAGKTEHQLVVEAGANFTFDVAGKAMVYRKKDFRYDLEQGFLTYRNAPPRKPPHLTS